jgi:hypothetical protein
LQNSFFALEYGARGGMEAMFFLVVRISISMQRFVVPSNLASIFIPLMVVQHRNKEAVTQILNLDTTSYNDQRY